MARNISKLPKGWLATLPQEAIAYLQSVEKRATGATLAEVDPLTPGDTDFTPTGNVSKGYTGFGPTVVQANLQYVIGLTNQGWADNFATIADALTNAATNIADIKTALDEINSRVTALEDKDNEIIEALTPT